MKKDKDMYGGFNQMPLEDREYQDYIIALAKMCELSDFAYQFNKELYKEINGFTY